MGALHQFVRTLERSAVGNHVLELQRLAVEEVGVASTVFAEAVHPSLAGRARPLADYGSAVPAAADDVLVYHHAVGAHTADVVATRPERLVVDHHNVTPPLFNEGWAPDVAYECAWGVRQLRLLAPRAELGVGDSSFNAGELAAAGCRTTAAAPILVDLSPFAGTGDVEPPGPTEWLFVGRMAPNKCQHDVVTAFAAYRRLYEPEARLCLVGGGGGRYGDAVAAHAEALGVGDAVRLLGSVSFEELVARYRAASVLVCLSEHEGYCVPLLEAMAAGVPVVAYASTAVPETLAGAGVLLDTKEPLRVAAAVAQVRGDDALRRSLRKAGAARAAELDLAPTRRRWAALLETHGLVGP
ncbi:MAG TPA: glycosyltransferase [Acidimicrobiales bacterium]|nr:glycosyltransferase [Acidimicrobiales bacterium]